jgi:hypothetical protein
LKSKKDFQPLQIEKIMMKNNEKDEKEITEEVINQMRNYLIGVKNMIDQINNEMQCDNGVNKKIAIYMANELIESVDGFVSNTDKINHKMLSLLKQSEPMH